MAPRLGSSRCAPEDVFCRRISPGGPTKGIVPVAQVCSLIPKPNPRLCHHFRTCLTLGVGNVIYGVMRTCGREFSSEVIARIEATVRGEPSLSRRALSLRVCEWL